VRAAASNRRLPAARVFKASVIGPEGSISALVAVSILPLAAAGSEEAGELAAALALLVGVLFVAAFLLRVSWMADYFSRPVLIGYIHGVAVVLVISQLGKVLGLDIDERNPLPQLWEEIRELGDIQWTTFAVGAISIAVLLLARLVMPRFPAALLVGVGAIAASWAFDLEDRGVRVVGALEGGLPPLDIPTPGLVDTIQLLPAALGIFLVSFADEILTARSFAGRHNQHIRARQELLAMGAANMASGITQGISVSASGSRTAVNDSMGARTQVAGAIAAGVVLAILIFLTDPIEYLPLAVLGAVIISAAIGPVDPDAWRALWNTDRVELTIAAVTTTGVIVYGVLEALALAVGLSIIDVVRRSANPHVAVLGWVREARALRGCLGARIGEADARCGRLPARRQALLRQCVLRQRAHTRSRARIPASGQLRRVRHGRHPRRCDGPGGAAGHRAGPAEGGHRACDRSSKVTAEEAPRRGEPHCRDRRRAIPPNRPSGSRRLQLMGENRRLVTLATGGSGLDDDQ
jgi:MFS superfamily sulfate permease-like transporter